MGEQVASGVLQGIASPSLLATSTIQIFLSSSCAEQALLAWTIELVLVWSGFEVWVHNLYTLSHKKLIPWSVRELLYTETG